MRKLIRTLHAHQVPKEFSRKDWDAATRAMFEPYFRRKQQLNKNIGLFHIELRNLARIALFPEYLDLLSWCLRLHRRVLKLDRHNAYENMIKLFDNMLVSDERWLNMFETSTPLEAGAATHDRVYQLFSTIDGVAEGCFKPQLQIIFAFAKRDIGGGWPNNVAQLDFGALVKEFPNVLKCQVPLLLADPDLAIPINQWRNIAAHKTFAMVGPQTIEITYGRGNVHSQHLGQHRLQRIWYWLLRTHAAVRLANTIIFIEHMPELYVIGLPSVKQRLSSTIIHISHDLSTVGFETVGWKTVKRDGILSVRDCLGRSPQEALIHASQMLDQLSIGILNDPTTRNRLYRARIALILPDGSLFGSACVPVPAADAFTRGKITLSEYLDNVQWSLERR